MTLNEVVVYGAAVIFGGAVMYVIFGSGETVGSVASTYVAFTGGTRRIRFVVKRHVAKKANAIPRVSLGVRVFMATQVYSLSAVEARRLADAIDQAAGTGGIAPFTDRRLGRFDVSRCFDDGSVGVSLGLEVADNTNVMAEFFGADARGLATLLRVAAAPGATLAQARVNARPKQAA